MSQNKKILSFRLDYETFEKIEQLKRHLSSKKVLSNSEVLRYAINHLEQTYKSKSMSDIDEPLSVIENYIKVAFLTAYEYRSDWMEWLLSEVERVYHDFIPEEVTEIANLYNEEEPLTIAKLVRFKFRELPETFLKIMGVKSIEFQDLSDDELAEFIIYKFSDKIFEFKAKKEFNIR